MNEEKIELFGLKAKDGSDWKLILSGRGTNWIEVAPVYRKTPKGKAEILKLNIKTDKQPSFDTFIMSCED